MKQQCSVCRQPLDWRRDCPWCQADADWRERDPMGWEAHRIRDEAMGVFTRSTARLPLHPDRAVCDRINAALLVAYHRADGLDGGHSSHRLFMEMEEPA